MGEIFLQFGFRFSLVVILSFLTISVGLFFLRLGGRNDEK